MRAKLWVLIAAFAASPAAEATTYVMVSDAALADQAAAIVRARVVEAGPAAVEGRPATDYLIDVEQVVQGYLPGSRVVVRVPGGIGQDGVGLRVFGAPEFAPGERALLFLGPEADGAHRILHLMLGAFHERRSGARRVAVRDFSGATEVVVGRGGEPSFHAHGLDRPRDLDRFADWLADRAAGVRRDRDYLLEEGAAGMQAAIAGYSLLASDRGHPVRWFRFDRGDGVSWRVHSAGQPGLGLDRSVAALKTALEAWNGDAGSDVRYTYGGTTSAGGGLSRADGTNAVLFDDPQRTIGGVFDCATGGVVALGGPFFNGATRAFNGKSYHEAVEADVVTNDGSECFFRDNPGGAEKVLAHELGHTLGLGHSADRAALMYATSPKSGQGARLEADDRQAVAALYPSAAPPPPAPPPAGGLAAPGDLAAQALSAKQVRLTWRDNSSGEVDFRVERSTAGGPFQEVLRVGAGTTSAKIGGLKPATAYAFRVRARDAAGLSPYSNTASVKTGGKR